MVKKSGKDGNLDKKGSKGPSTSGAFTIVGSKKGKSLAGSALTQEPRKRPDMVSDTVPTPTRPKKK